MHVRSSHNTSDTHLNLSHQNNKMRFFAAACLLAVPSVLAGGVPTPAPRAERAPVEQRQSEFYVPECSFRVLIWLVLSGLESVASAASSGIAQGAR